VRAHSQQVGLFCNRRQLDTGAPSRKGIENTSAGQKKDRYFSYRLSAKYQESPCEIFRPFTMGFVDLQLERRACLFWKIGTGLAACQNHVPVYASIAWSNVVYFRADEALASEAPADRGCLVSLCGLNAATEKTGRKPGAKLRGALPDAVEKIWWHRYEIAGLGIGTIPSLINEKAIYRRDDVTRPELLII
jgi:hypothetical protein